MIGHVSAVNNLVGCDSIKSSNRVHPIMMRNLYMTNKMARSGVIPGNLKFDRLHQIAGLVNKLGSLGCGLHTLFALKSPGKCGVLHTGDKDPFL